ncbi:hypothetical protein ACTVZO_17830 [Streptomyces sp. IBSNAI002]|uniref:hypothetical protein n=1 Tax=Streptomyces sp. IBSNAI002 TaxID=3457500 RepID=UPI003FD6121A
MPYPTWSAGQRVTAALLTAMQPITVVKTIDEPVTASTTLQDDNQLILPLEAAATYTVRGALFYDGQFNAGNLKLSWALPAGASIFWSANGPALGGAAAYASQAVTSGNISVGTYGTGGSKTTASIVAHVTTSAAGNMILRWAQDTSHATPTQIYAKSFLQAIRIT